MNTSNTSNTTTIINSLPHCARGYITDSIQLKVAGRYEQ